MFFNCTKDPSLLMVDREDKSPIQLRLGTGAGGYERLVRLDAEGGETLLVYDCQARQRLVHHKKPRTMPSIDFEQLSKWKVMDLGYGDGAFAIANLGPLNDDAGMCLLYFDRESQTFAVKNMDDDPAACCRFRFHGY